MFLGIVFMSLDVLLTTWALIWADHFLQWECCFSYGRQRVRGGSQRSTIWCWAADYCLRLWARFQDPRSLVRRAFWARNRCPNAVRLTFLSITWLFRWWPVYGVRSILPKAVLRIVSLYFQSVRAQNIFPTRFQNATACPLQKIKPSLVEESDYFSFQWPKRNRPFCTTQPASLGLECFRQTGWASQRIIMCRMAIVCTWNLFIRKLFNPGVLCATAICMTDRWLLGFYLM